MMRKPLQKQNYVSIPNEFFDEWVIELEPTAVVVLLFIVRKTLGWQKQEDWIAMSQFESGTQLSKPTILKALLALQEKEMIFKRVEGEPGQERMYYKLNAVEVKSSYQSNLFTGSGVDPVKTFNETSKDILPTKYNIQKTRSKDSAAPGGSDTKGFIDYFFEQYKAKFGVKYHVNGGKDGSIAKALLKKMTLEELKKRVDVFLSTQDAFYEKAGYTIGCFSSQINKLNLKIAGKTKSSLLQRERNGEYAIPVKSLT